MVKRDDERCPAHSGVVTELRIGGAIIGALMIIFSSLLYVTWKDGKEASAAIIVKVDSISEKVTVMGRDMANHLQNAGEKPAWKR